MTRGFGRFLRRNTIALVALFVALGGTSAFAAATLINGSQIKPHTIAKNRLTNKAVKQLKGNRGPRGLQGPAGPTGAQGTAGAQGPAGPVGPSNTSQAYTLGNLTLGANFSSAVTITTLTLAGPAFYQVNAAGMVFRDTASAGALAGIDIALNGSELGGFFNEIGTESANEPENYAISRLVHITGSSGTISIRGWNVSGAGTLAAFTNSLDATHVGSGIGSQRPTGRSDGPVGVGVAR